MKNNKVLNVLKWLWIAVVISAAGYFFYRNIDKFVDYIRDLSVMPMVFSLGLIILSRIVQADFTRMSLKKIGQRVNFTDAVNISGMTQLGKYLPGGVWQFAGKLGVYKVRGFPLKLSAKAMILENFWLLSSAIVLGVLSILQFNNQLFCRYIPFLCSPDYRVILEIAVIVIWLLALFLVEKILIKDSYTANLPDYLVVLIEQISVWVLSGISFLILFNGQGSPAAMLQFIGAFSISWAAGFVAFFASGGIGIRELVLTITLAALLPTEEVLIIASIHRLLWTLADLIVGVGSSLVFGMPVNKEKNE